MIKKYISGFLFVFTLTIYGQSDMIDGYTPRNLTRGKMWSTYRNNGLEGGGNRHDSGSHSQECLTYPGNMSRVGVDFVEYFIDVEAYISGNPNVIEMPRATIPQSSRGQGVWVLGINDGDTLVSHSGPRHVTNDIEPKVYDIANSPESILGDSTSHNYERSNYSAYHTNIQSREPVEIHNYRYHEYTAHNSAPEEIIISQWMTKHGVQVTRKAYAWGYPEYDDFIIQDIIFDNKGDSILDSVYFALMNAFNINSMGHQWAEGHGMGWSDWRGNRLQTQDDIYFYTKSDTFIADESEYTENYNNHILFYQRDSDWLGTSWDDTGQPYKLEVATQRSTSSSGGYFGQEQDQLLSYQYIGMGVVDYLPDNSEYVHPLNTTQPAYAKWWHSGNIEQYDYQDPNANQHTDAEMYKMVIGENECDITNTPRDPDLGTHAFVFGPYHLQPGEKAKLVVAYVGGSGADWKKEDEITWSKTPQAKLEVKYGERSLFRNFEKAKFAYENKYNIPDPPPDVNIWFGNSQLGQVIINWNDDVEDALDPDYEGQEAMDVRGYRIYKSWPPSHYWHNGPWELLLDISIGDTTYYNPETGIYTYTDSTSFSGYNYYYSVHTYDSGHDHWFDINGNDLGPIPSLESGMSSPEQRNAIAITPFQASLPIYNEMKVPIRVVPNPYRLDYGDPLHRYPDSADPYKLRFTNLPGHCKIKIYSTSGDLVFEKEHLKATSAEYSWRQETISFSGHIVSGLYFWVVESLTEESFGNIQKGTLAIVK